MTPFSYSRAETATDAIRLGGDAGAKFLGGGTNLVDLMRETIERPSSLVDVTGLDDGIVEPGMLVTVEMFDEEETFLLGHREIKGDSGLEVFSEQSPLGKSINGKKVGQSAKYQTPSGKTITVKILKAQPYKA